MEVDVKGFFDAISHKHLRSFLDRRVRDGVIRRSIDKWLKAGVLEDGVVKRAKDGTPQGSVVSPILSNIYLHEVLDKWFVEMVKPRMRGAADIFRFADDFLIVFDNREDADRVYKAIEKRFARYDLELHPEKTKLIDFNRPAAWGRERKETFTFLGFTYYWTKSRRGYPVVKRRTAKEKLNQSLGRIKEWCHKFRHKPLAYQQKKLNEKLRGHYAYYGIRGNYEALSRYYNMVILIWRKWLGRRSQRWTGTWEKFIKVLKRFPLQRPKIVHSNV